MNAESQRLGMTDLHWVNPHGLHDVGQYSSPRDLAILAAALRNEFPQYRASSRSRAWQTGGKAIPNHNNLIARFDGADGMKTGYTCPAGFNLVATRHPQRPHADGGRGRRKSVEARDDKAADMLLRGFATMPDGGPMLTDLKASRTPSSRST